MYFFDRTQSCNPYFEKPKPPRGHYEKIEKKGTKYFFVDSDKPSGIPGALVISKEEAEGKPPGGRGTTDRYDVHAWKFNKSLNFKNNFYLFIYSY